MYNVMKKLIEKKFYKTSEEAQNKLDVFYACNRLTDEQYTELTTLIEETYEQMNDLEFQENLTKLTVAELLEEVNRLTESYSHKLALVTEELLIRQMQLDNDSSVR